MSIPLVIIGAGGFGREVHDVLIDLQQQPKRDVDFPDIDFLGFLDDGQPDVERLASRDARWLGPVSKLTDLPAGTRYSIGIGSGSVRRRIDEWATALGIEPLSLVHSSATFGLGVAIGPGTVICAHVSVTTNVHLGRHVHLNLSSTVGHDAVLDDYVTVNPLAAVSGEVHLESEVTVGTTASINQGLTVGRGSTLGSGASAVRDIPAGVVAVGVPARPR